MAEDKKEFIALPSKEVAQEYKVKKEFTLDELYKPGSKILLKNGKIKDTLISNKFI